MLPESWVNRIFARLTVRYGDAWLRMWDGLDMNAVKADWARTLAWYGQGEQEQPPRSKAIEYALDNLPLDRPPNAMQFREICKRMPAPALPRLAAPQIDKAAAVQVLQRARAALATRRYALQWAVDLQARELAGERLTEHQRASWRQALREGVQ